MIGRRLAHYDITAHLGSGAMGEVYQATDGKLGRSVALKLLPVEVAHDADRVERFAREAKLLASLNHPGVAAIYGLEEAAGRRFLVMELVPGQTLADRIGGRPLKWDEALVIGKQIAEALEAAHDRGVVHRDLKPSNVKITPDGRTKVLDFGLAKLAANEVARAGGEQLANAETLSALTHVGAVLGTPAYMSPEQAAGRQVDRRTDVFAFGCVLYEMLTGRRPFEGGSVAEVVSSVMQSDPDWKRVPGAVPPGMIRLVRLCLEKDPRKRRQSAGDIRVDLERVQAEPGVPTATAPRRGARLALLTGSTVAIAAIAALAVPAVIHFREPPPPVMRLQVVTPPTNAASDFALSPDGRYLVFVATGASDGVRRLYLRPLAENDARPMPGTDGARQPFWSPDSRSVGFFASGTLSRIELGGGPPQALAPATSFNGGAWGSDGTILFSPDGVSPLFRVPAEGGEVEAATRLDAPRQSNHVHPSFLPDGRRFLYFSHGSDPDARGLFLGSLDSGEAQRLVPAGSRGMYLAPGRIAYLQQGALVVRGFDPARGVLTGDPVTLADSVEAFSVSASGIVAHRAATAHSRWELAWFDRSGNLLQHVNEWWNGPELSPDGRRMTGDHTVNGNRDIWVLDLARGAATRLTTHPALEGYPLWSPDGSRIAFHSSRNGTIDLWIMTASGAGDEELLLEQPESEWPIDWSQDGRFLLYQRSDLGAGWDLWALPMTGDDRTPVAVATTPFKERLGEISPDGRWVVYDTEESGRMEIVVQAFPVPSERLPVSTAGGTGPRWSADGSEIYFIALDGTMMAVPVEATGAALELGTPQTLFATLMTFQPFKFMYAVSRDGRFLSWNAVEDPTAPPSASDPPITILLNAVP